MSKRQSTFSLPRSKRTKMNVIKDGDTDMDEREKNAMSTDPMHAGWSLAPGPPTYTHVVLPYINEYTVVNTVGSNLYEFGYRMTSVYDPSVVNEQTDIQPGTAVTNAITLSGNDSKDNNSGYPAYYRYYASLYNYYSVIGCRYSITIENLSHDRQWVHLLFHNQTVPPRSASNHDMLLWKGVKSKVLMPAMRFATTNNVSMLESNVVNYDGDTASSSASNAQAASWVTESGRSSSK